MKCPKCEGSLELKESEGHIGRMCSLCYGIWLSEKYLASLEYNHEFEAETFKNTLKTSEEHKTSNICPSCLIDLKSSKINGIALEWCPSCEGVWFDKNELHELITKHNKLTKGEKVVWSLSDIFIVIGMLLGG